MGKAISNPPPSQPNPEPTPKLRPGRSGASGFLLPLSGGADSSSVAAIVGCMAQMVCQAAAAGDEQVLADAIRCGGRGWGMGQSGQAHACVAELLCRLALMMMMPQGGAVRRGRDAAGSR